MGKPFDAKKLASLVNKSSTARTGGKGSVRRKHKVVRKATTGAEEKKVKSILNRLQVRDIPACEEVNLFKDDGTVIHFSNPKVQAAITANTYVVSGNAETKKLGDLLPGIITQLGPDSLEQLKRAYASISKNTSSISTKDDDEDIPALVQGKDFESVSKQTASSTTTSTASSSSSTTTSST